MIESTDYVKKVRNRKISIESINLNLHTSTSRKTTQIEFGKNP
jgi:hypothetical protein